MNAIRILVAQQRAIEAHFDELQQETRRRTRVSALSRLAEELIAHMAAEEAVFYPAVKRVLDEGREVGERARRDHLMLRIELRRVLETNVADPAFGDRVAGLRKLFAEHVREEQELFLRVVGATTRTQLDVLGAELLASRPPVWIVTSEGRSLIRSGDGWALRSSATSPASRY